MEGSQSAQFQHLVHVSVAAEDSERENQCLDSDPHGSHATSFVLEFVKHGQEGEPTDILTLHLIRGFELALVIQPPRSSGLLTVADIQSRGMWL